MADVTEPESVPAPRESNELALREQPGELTPCPSCGRRTLTVGRGTCADCWQAKTPDGEPAVRAVRPRTLPLLGSIDVPTWAWFALATGVAGLLLTALTYTL